MGLMSQPNIDGALVGGDSLLAAPQQTPEQTPKDQRYLQKDPRRGEWQLSLGRSEIGGIWVANARVLQSADQHGAPPRTPAIPHARAVITEMPNLRVVFLKK